MYHRKIAKVRSSADGAEWFYAFGCRACATPPSGTRNTRWWFRMINFSGGIGGISSDVNIVHVFKRVTGKR